MNQIALNFSRARCSDPYTSHEAAAKAIEFSHGHYKIILDALKRYGGCTIHDLEFANVLDRVECARRLSEMEKLGMVYWQGDRKSPNGRKCRVWWVK